MDFEALDDQRSNPSTNYTFNDISATWMSRRQALGLGFTSLVTALLPRQIQAQEASLTYGFTPVSLNSDDAIQLPAGYRWQKVASWGDPLTPGAKPFNFAQQSALDQARQFGFNNDFVGYCPLPAGKTTVTTACFV